MHFCKLSKLYNFYTDARSFWKSAKINYQKAFVEKVKCTGSAFAGTRIFMLFHENSVFWLWDFRIIWALIHEVPIIWGKRACTKIPSPKRKSSGSTVEGTPRWFDKNAT